MTAADDLRARAPTARRLLLRAAEEAGPVHLVLVESEAVVASGRTSTSKDAAEATAAAVDHRQPGIYNIVDDDPAPVREYLPVLASALGAKPARRIRRWLGRVAAGEMATVMMTEVRGASNEKAKRELGWKPRYVSWRQGFAQGLG